MPFKDLEKRRVYNKKWKTENRGRVCAYNQNWHRENPERNGVYAETRHQKYPWLNSYAAARQRCLYLKSNRYSVYGGRGIQFRLTLDEMGVLWLRDGADKMRRPSIDRVDNDGHYEMANCRFIELVKNRPVC